MKFIAILAAIVAAISAGFSFAQGSYGFAFLNVCLIFLNMSTYSRILAREESNKDQQ